MTGRKDILSIKAVQLVPKGSVLEQVKERDQWQPADPGSPGKLMYEMLVRHQKGHPAATTCSSFIGGL